MCARRRAFMPPSRAHRPRGAAGPNAAEGAQSTMKKEEVEVGGTYLAKVGARSVEVKIESENAKGGWNAKSVASGKPIRLKDPKHLRPAKGDGAADTEAGDDADQRGPADESDLVPLTQLDRAKKKSTGKKGKARGERPAKSPREKNTTAAKEKKPKAMSALDA